VIGTDGSSLREITNAKTDPMPAWSPDGNSLVFNTVIQGKHNLEKNAVQLETIDLNDARRSVIPSSQDMVGVIWVTPDTLIAGTADSTKLVTIDAKTGKEAELVSGLIVDWAASLDRKYLYYNTGEQSRKLCVRLKMQNEQEIRPVGLATPLRF
jgi:WD40-like Beta Propeller Repeat